MSWEARFRALVRGATVVFEPDGSEEGRPQMTSRAAFPPGDAKEDWAIVRALSAQVGHKLPYDSLSALRAAMYKEAPALARLDMVAPADRAGVEALAARGGALGPEPFGTPVRDFYLTNAVARASAVMAELSALKKATQQGTTGTQTGTLSCGSSAIARMSQNVGLALVAHE